MLAAPSLIDLHLAAKLREHSVSVTLYEAGLTLTNIITFELPLNASFHNPSTTTERAMEDERGGEGGGERKTMRVFTPIRLQCNP